jgi:hypothetical protein
MNKVVAAAYLFVVGLLVALGGFLLFKGLRNVQLAVESAKWPVTSGVVVSSETTRSVTRDERKNRSSVTFDTKTVIHYAVNGHEYDTDVLHFGQTLGSSDKSDAALQRLRYPAGAKVPVSYNPANPSVGVMKPGLHAEAFWLPGAGLAFLLPAVLCLAMGPSLFRDVSKASAEEQEFARQVHEAIETGRPSTFTPPRMAGDSVMPVAVTAFGAVFCCLGMLALAGGMVRIWHGYASQSWPTTTGQVIMAYKGGGEGDEAGEDPSDDSTDPAYQVRFVYRYDVAGVTHFNNLRRFAEAEGGDKDDVARIAERYRKGANVRVSYFPADPDVAVLEPGNTSDALWLPGLGVVLLLFSLAVFVWVVPGVSKPI